MKYKYLKHIVGGVFVALVFVIFSLISQAYSNELQYLTEQSGFFGVVSYVGIMMVSIVVAPI